MTALTVPFFRPSFSAEDLCALADVLESGIVTTGPRAADFERCFREHLHIAHATSVSSCSAALHLALLAGGIRPGDVVFVPTFGFASDAQAVEWCGATPVFVDVAPETLCIDPNALERSIHAMLAGGHADQRQLRAVIAVDYAGQMADYAALQRICEAWGLLIIEDAAHALPAATRADASQGWRSPGSVADMACFSFYANKSITTGEGGMVVTDRAEWAERIVRMRAHGVGMIWPDAGPASWNRQVISPGYKYNLPDLNAALGLSQMNRLHAFHQARCVIAEHYSEALGDCPWLDCPVVQPNRQHAWHVYAVRLKGPLARGARLQVLHAMKQRGVELSIHWYPLHQHARYRERGLQVTALDVAEAVYPSLFSLPIFPSMTGEELAHVVTHLRAVIEEVANLNAQSPQALSSQSAP